MKQFRKIDIDDLQTSLFQENVAEIFELTAKNPLIDGQIVETALNFGDNEIEHRLGRNYIGWIAVDSSLSGVVSFADQATASRNKSFTVTWSGVNGAKVKLWVF